MTKSETLKLLNKIKAYYSNFSIEDNVKEEWVDRLKDYDYEDVINKFEEHLRGERALEPPKLHFITRYLKTTEEKTKASNDYIIRCDLCGKEMYLSKYENEHRKKCLHIKTLIPILTARGEKVSYEILDEYDYETLDKLVDKYLKTDKNISGIFKKI